MSMFLHRAGLMIPGAVRARFVGSYPIDFAGTTSATAAVPIADLEYPATRLRQILVFVAAEAPTPLGNVTIDGVSRPYFVNDGGTFILAAGGQLTTTADFNVVVTVFSASSEVGRIVIYEIEGAAPLRESFRCGRMVFGATTMPYFVTIPVGGVAIGAAFGSTDTGTFTWSGILSEDVDVDAGDYRISSASSLTPQTSIQRTASTIANTVNTPLTAVLGICPIGSSFVRGGSTIWRGLASADPTTSAPNLTSSDSTNRGNYKFLVVVATESDSTIMGITFGAGAMTQIASVRNTTATPDLQIEVWAIDIVESNFNGSISIDWSSAPGSTTVIRTYDLYGVGSVGTPQSITGNGTGDAVAVDVAEGGCILGFHMRGGFFSGAAWVGLDERTDLAFDSTFVTTSAERFICSAETGRSVQATGLSAEEYATLVIPFNP